MRPNYTKHNNELSSMDQALPDVPRGFEGGSEMDTEDFGMWRTVDGRRLNGGIGLESANCHYPNANDSDLADPATATVDSPNDDPHAEY